MNKETVFSHFANLCQEVKTAITNIYDEFAKSEMLVDEYKEAFYLNDDEFKMHYDYWSKYKECCHQFRKVEDLLFQFNDFREKLGELYDPVFNEIKTIVFGNHMPRDNATSIMRKFKEIQSAGKIITGNCRVKYSYGTIVPIDCNVDMTLEEVKERIGQEEHVYPYSLRLFHNGRVLRDDYDKKTLTELGVKEGDEIIVTFRQGRSPYKLNE